MDINAFYTTQTGNNTTKGAAATQALSGKGLFASGLAGASFMDLIFARSIANAEAGKANDGKGTDSNAQAPSLISLINKSELTAEESALLDETLAQLKNSGVLIEGALADLGDQTDPLSSQQILQSVLRNDPDAFTELNLETAKAELNGAAAQNLKDLKAIKSLKDLNEFLKNLLAGLPENAQPVITKVNGQDLQFDPTAEDSGENLIATGLSISDLTKLIQDIANGDEQGEGVVIGMVQILPTNAQGKKDAVFTPRGVIIPQQPATPANETLETVAAKLNSMTVGEADEDGTGIFTKEGKLTDGADFDSVLKVLERAQSKVAATGKEAPGLEKAIKRIQQLSAGNSTVPGQAALMSEIFAEFEISDIFPEGFDMKQATGTPAVNPLNNALAQITSIITSVQQAGHPHPASQAVAQVVAKASGQGENRNFTIQLDPPDLGKVQIRLEFAKDKAMKAHLLVEKPETHLMLQRDAQLLERTLHDMGVDTDGNSFSFELAQDGNLFDHNQKDQGGNSGPGGGKGGAAEDEELVVIETTMDWHVNPETGHTHYNLLV